MILPKSLRSLRSFVVETVTFSFQTTIFCVIFSQIALFIDQGLKMGHFFEYWLTRAALFVIPRIPRRGIVLFSRFFGWLGYYGAGHLRKTGWANLNIAFGSEKSDAEKKAILQESFQTFTLTMLDLLWFTRDTKNRIIRCLVMNAGGEEFYKDVATISLTAHSGNWELMGKAATLRGDPITSMAAPLKNTKLNDLFISLRTDTGQIIVSKKGAVRELIKTLKKGGKIALLLDQNTKPSDGGVFIDFFGLPVPVSTIVGALAMHSSPRLYFSTFIADKNGQYHPRDCHEIVISDITDTNRTARNLAISQRVLEAVEQHVKQYPGAWLWMYKRWKYVAPGKKREDYPFYAKEMLDVDKKAAAKTQTALREG